MEKSENTVTIVKRIISPKKYLLIFFSVLMLTATAVAQKSFNLIKVIVGREADTIEMKAARLLSDRLMEKSSVTVEIVSEDPENPDDHLFILLGRPDHHSAIREVFDQYSKTAGPRPGLDGGETQRVILD